jgi:hypothetical protein
MKFIEIPIYTIGKQVSYQNRYYNIEKVVISGYNIFLTLSNDTKINADMVSVPLTKFYLERVTL